MATKDIKKNKRRERSKRGIRRDISGTPETPRLSVFRSNRYIYAQLIDDVGGQTLAAASSKGLEGTPKPIEAAKAVGQLLAERAKEKGVAVAVFDRNGYRYHGRVQALAEGAREGGLKL
ncbi:MAG: 50S ribosomal protein L18 [Rhodothermales bacterium]|nr:50S ribosomal protein L18 [Rhodothermales bacterium]